MKINYIGIVAGILAFVSIALPWWTMSVTVDSTSESWSVYLYQQTVSTGTAPNLNMWYAWAALGIIVISGILLIVGSVTSMGKKLLVGGGVLALISIIIFAVGLQMDLSDLFSGTVGLFSAPSPASAYLTFGFWLALVAMILAFVAYVRHPKEAAPPPAPA